mmetsp:Transcript_88102/g.254141  ORF Transcript_88102/g.254141 Transcript_88102/m.254141 type:complete len:731 (+) Transcript_88102:55-2247(+)
MIAALTSDGLKKDYRKHYDLAMYAENHTANIEELKQHYDKNNLTCGRNRFPDYYFIRLIGRLQGSLSQAKKVCASYNHASGLGCLPSQQGRGCPAEVHECAMCGEKHPGFSKDSRGTRGDEFLTCRWLRAFEKERVEMERQLHIDTASERGMQELLHRRKEADKEQRRKTGQVRKAPSPASTKTMPPNGFAALGSESGSDSEPAAGDASSGHSQQRGIVTEEDAAGGCDESPSRARPLAPAALAIQEDDAQAPLGEPRPSAEDDGLATRKSKKKKRQRAARKTRSELGAPADEAKVTKAALAKREGMSQSAVEVTADADEESPSRPGSTGNGIAGNRQDKAASEEEGSEEGSDESARPGGIAMPLCPPPPGLEEVLSAGSPASSATGGWRGCKRQKLSGAGKLATSKRSRPMRTSLTLRKLWGRKIGRPKFEAKLREPAHVTEGAAMGPEAGPGRRQQHGSQQPQYFSMASESESESDPTTTDDDFAGCSFVAGKGGAAGPSAAGGCDGLLSLTFEAALQENQSLKEEIQFLEEQACILEERLRRQEEDNLSLKKHNSLLKAKLRRFERPTVMSTGVSGAEVHGDTGSSVGAPTDAQAPSQSTTPSQKAQVAARIVPIAKELKNRVKASATYPTQSFGNPGDLPRFLAQQDIEEIDPQKRDELRAKGNKSKEEARQSNEARHSGFGPREQQRAASSDRDRYDGTWASVNGTLTIREVQDGNDPDETEVLE